MSRRGLIMEGSCPDVGAGQPNRDSDRALTGKAGQPAVLTVAACKSFKVEATARDMSTRRQLPYPLFGGEWRQERNRDGLERVLRTTAFPPRMLPRPPCRSPA